MAKRRLLIDGTTLSSKMDGLSQYILNVILNFSEEEFDYTLLIRPNECESSYRSQFKALGVNIEEVNIAAIGPLRDIQFRRYLKRNEKNFDCAFIPSNQFPLALSLPCIYTIHDLIYEEFPSQLGKLSLIKRSYLHWVVKVGLKKATQVVAVSEFTKQDILKRHSNVNPEKISVVYEGWEHLKTIQEAESIKPAFENYFFYVGSARGHKNLHRLIEAISIVQDALPKDYGVIIAGNTKQLSQEQLSMINAINAQRKCIALTGWLTNEELLAYFSRASAFIFPSLSEGFGIPVLEAFYHKVPILLSNQASLPEVAGDAAIYFNPNSSDEIADAMVYFIDHRDEIVKTLISKGETRLKEFSWMKTSKEIISLLHEL